MKKRTKILIIVAVAVVVLAVTGFFVGKHYVVNYAFDKFFETGMAGLINSAPVDAEQNGEIAGQPGDADGAEPDLENESGEATPSGESTGEKNESDKKADTQNDKPSSQKAPEEMTEREVINEVMKDSSLTSKMSGMISSSDRQRIISIVLSNFTSVNKSLIIRFSLSISSAISCMQPRSLLKEGT